MVCFLQACTYTEYLEFSHDSGFYTEAFTLRIDQRKSDKYEIRYTIDGSNPSKNSLLFQDSLRLDLRAKEYQSALIPTTPMEGPDPLGFFKWRKPIQEPERMHVLRFQLFKKGKAFGPIQERTFFIQSDLDIRFDMKVLNLNFDPEDLFDENKGIYVAGNAHKSDRWNAWWPKANFSMKWKKNAHLTLFDKRGNVKVEEDVTAKVVGFGVSGFPQKSLRLDFKKKRRKYTGLNEVYENYSYAPSTIILRNSGQDFTSTMFRDLLAHKIADDLDFEKQLGWPVAVFINGEYWGIQNIREKVDEYYFEKGMEIEKKEYSVYEDCGTPVIGDKKAYNKLQKFLRDSTKTFEDFEELIDINSAVDYILFEMYIGNYDWPSVNNKYWKEKDGKWRWILNDVDYSFGFSNMGIKHNAEFNAFENGTVINNDVWPHKTCATYINHRLFGFPEFRELFKSRYQELAVTTFEPKALIARIDAMQKKYEHEMKYHIARWQYPWNKGVWYGEIQQMRDFVTQRPAIFEKQMIEYFTTR